jgi:replicative superfamily II helicase
MSRLPAVYSPEGAGRAQMAATRSAFPMGLVDALPRTDLSMAWNALRETQRYGVAFHTADLARDERLVVEEHFRSKESKIRVIAATTTLAMGVNTPAEAVIIAGLMHPGDVPYSVAEYKNIVGRAGRMGFAEHGASYLLATDPLQVHNSWNHSVKGTPEDLQSRFVAEGTDPSHLDPARPGCGAQRQREGRTRERHNRVP